MPSERRLTILQSAQYCITSCSGVVLRRNPQLETDALQLAELVPRETAVGDPLHVLFQTNDRPLLSTDVTRIF